MKSVFMRFGITAAVVAVVAFGYQNCAEQAPPTSGNGDLGSVTPNPSPNPPPGGNPITPSPPVVPPPAPGPNPSISNAGVGWVNLLTIWISGASIPSNAQVIVTAGGAAAPAFTVTPVGPTATGTQFLVPTSLLGSLNSTNGVDLEILNPTTGQKSTKFRIYRPGDKGRLAAIRYFSDTIPGHYLALSDVGGVGSPLDLTSLGYSYMEGVRFYASPRQTTDFSVPIYQCVRHGQNDSTFLTTQANCEGVANAEVIDGLPWFYLSPSATQTSTGPKVQVFRCYHVSLDRHLFATDTAECTDHGYVVENWAGAAANLYGWVNGN